MRSAFRIAVFVSAVLCAEGLAAQIQVRDLVVTGGVAGEGYSGNLSAVTVVAIDSTRNAQAAIGEFGAHLNLVGLTDDANRLLDVNFDLGLRQFAATGFKVRDYAPREWVGSMDAGYSQALSGWGSLTASAGFKGRWVEDRPPMPLFLQPGYNQVNGGLQLTYFAQQRFSFDAGIRAKRENYHAPAPVPQLDLLDKNSVTMEAGLRVLNAGPDATMRFFTLFERSEYPQQGSFDVTDPTRRDNTLKLGVQWSRQGAADLIDVAIGVEGTVNRSNSRRPEYDAAAFRAEVSFPFWWGVDVSLFTVLTGKSYIFETDFARLVPGEEADNASLAQISFTRALAPNLDGVVRFGWTRAETDIGNQYYQRYGVTVLFNFRPAIN
jgi:hypothetical protein